jgi:hypothetical protein
MGAEHWSKLQCQALLAMHGWKFRSQTWAQGCKCCFKVSISAVNLKSLAVSRRRIVSNRTYQLPKEGMLGRGNLLYS